MDKLTNYRIKELLTFGEIRAKEFRHRKALKDNLLKLLLRPETLLLCLTFGADRRIELNRYLLLRFLVVLRQYTHCTWSTFRHHSRFVRPTCNGFIYPAPSELKTHKAITCHSVLHRLTADLKWVADNVLSRHFTRT